MDSSSGRLYRILSFDRAVQIFENKHLHFALPAMWPDPEEQRLVHVDIGNIFGQCWGTRAVSDAMWRIYSPNHLGVRISTTEIKLKRAISRAIKDKKGILRLAPVEYKTTQEIDLIIRNIRYDLESKHTTQRAMDALFYKRLAFDYESEYRALVHIPNSPPECSSEGIKLGINPHELIDSILLDPRAPKELTEAFKFYFKEKLGFKKTVQRSVLYKSRTPYVVGEDDI